MVANEGKITTFGTTGTLGGLVDGTDTIHTGVAKTLFAIASGCRVVSSGTFTQSSDDFVLANPTTYRTLGTKVTLSSSSGHNTVTVSAGDSTYDRYDLIYIDAGNNRLAISAGQVNPARIADINNDDVPVAIVKVAAGAAATDTHSFQTLMSVYNTDDFASDTLSNLTIGADADGTDRTITFGHSTLKTIMGIDDSADSFVINTDDAFDSTLANNSLTIDASHNVTIAGDLTVGGNTIKASDGGSTIEMDTDDNVTIGGDLTVTGGDVSYSNAQDATLKVTATTSTTAGRDLTIEAGSTSTGSNNINGGDLILKSGGGDGTGTSTMSFHTKVDGTDTAAERMKINTTGNLELTGTDITLGGDSDGSDKKITFGHATIKSVMGIDDSGDVFAINTDDAFEAINDLQIDTAGNVTLGNGGLTLSGGNIAVTGAISATTTLTAGTGLINSGAFVQGNDVLDSNSASAVTATHRVIFVHNSNNSTNNELVLPIVSAGAGTPGQTFTFKNVTANSENIIISVGGSDKLDNDSVLHPMVETAGKIMLRPNESVTVTATTDSETPLVPGYYIIDSVGVGLGKKSIWVPAASMYPTTTNGCSALTQVELSNGPELKCLDFDDGSDEHAQFTVAFPKSWDGGSVTFKAYWCSTATDTDGVSWALRGCGMNDNETINLTFGSAVVVDDANQGAANELCVTAESGNITIAGTPAADDLTFFEIFRDVSDSNDTAAEDARLLGIKLFYTVNAGNDF